MQAYHWAFDAKGGFIVCSEHGNYGYAYPTSEDAVKAALNPRQVADRLARDADNGAIGGATLRQHNVYLRDCLAIADQTMPAQDLPLNVAFADPRHLLDGVEEGGR